MRFLPASLVIHRWCPKADSLALVPVGESRDGKLIHLARPETVEAFKAMAAKAKKDKIELHVIWAYRSPDLQTQQFEEAEKKHGRGKGIRWLAPPGFSEHQTGWALDIGDWGEPQADDNPLFEHTHAFQWLMKHAGAFRFELSFKPNNWQGVSYEPWHWRYVGTAEARRAFHPNILRAGFVWGRSWKEALERHRGKK